MVHLALVKHDVGSTDCAEGSYRKPDASHDLLSEAKSIENFYGKNIYSDFLIKNGCRPDPLQAKAIACLMGVYLRDSAGDYQPAPSKAEQHLKKRSQAERRLRAQCWGALSYIEEFSRYSHLNPADVLKQASRHSDAKTIRSSLQTAIDWLTRIDSEFQARENEAIGAA